MHLPDSPRGLNLERCPPTNWMVNWAQSVFSQRHQNHGLPRFIYLYCMVESQTQMDDMVHNCSQYCSNGSRIRFNIRFAARPLEVEPRFGFGNGLYSYRGLLGLQSKTYRAQTLKPCLFASCASSGNLVIAPIRRKTTSNSGFIRDLVWPSRRDRVRSRRCYMSEEWTSTCFLTTFSLQVSAFVRIYSVYRRCT